MNADAFLNLFQTAVLLVILLGTIRLIGTQGQSIRLVFFAFAIASVLLSNLYWFAYDVLRPGTRMPFAANEIGEWAMFLLFGAALNPAAGQRSAKWEMLLAALFALCNTGLWIAWSGEWVQDILTGIVFGYFLCCLVARMKQENALDRWERWLLCVGGFVLIGLQAGLFFAPDPIKTALDLFCYGLLFAIAVLLIVRTILALRKEPPEAVVCRAFLAHAWCVTALYMSADGFYIAAMMLTTLCFLLIFLSIRKEVLPV